MNSNLKLDINNWKSFRVGDIFELQKCKCNNASNFDSGSDIYYIGAKKNDNGIMEMVEFNNDLITNGNCIIFIGGGEGSAGYTNYMSRNFIGASNLTVGYNKNLNKYNGLFLVKLLDLERPKYSFGRSWTGDRLEKTIIKLPTTPQGEPDFKFMENYIKNIYDKLEQKIISKNKTKNKIELKIENWKEFKIGDLFEVKLSKGDLKLSQLNSGNIKLISAISNDNGIIGFIDSEGDGKAEIFDKNSITIDMFCNVFYQNEKFYSVSHGRVNILVPNFSLNKYIGLFFTTLLQNEIYRFSYGRAVYSEEAKNLIIKLPTTPQGEPDFEFMENYIKSLPYGDLI